MKNKGLIAIISIVALGVVAYFILKKLGIIGKNGGNGDKGASLKDFEFFQGKDSPAGDVIFNPSLKDQPKKMAIICGEFKECLGFNTQGYFKGSIKPTDQWKSYPNAGKHEGLYIKKKP